MNLVIFAAFIAVCGAAKLDRTYLPPSSANTAGGSPGSLQTPLTRTSEQGLETPKLPTGSYTNDFEGVVVDAASPGTRASPGAELSGLGEPRPSYGSTDSKVGDAAFRATPGFRAPLGANQFDNHAGFASQQAGQFPTEGFESKSERPQAANDRKSNIVAFSSDVSSDNYSYGFETDNGIAVGENGVAVNGVQAEGGYSYKGDDGQVYKVTYTADEGGYRPHGAHLPTPPPIPEEILKSLEKNAKEEAAGLVDDGSYDAQKYNRDGDYTHDNGGSIQHNGGQLSQFEKRPESDATAGTLINQATQGFGKPTSGSESYTQNHAAFNTQTSEENRRPGQFGNINTHNSHSNFNNLQANGKPELGQFLHHSASQNSHFTINGQTSHNADSNSQSSHSSQQNGHFNAPSGVNTVGQNTGSQYSSQGSQETSFGSQSQFGSQLASQASALSQFGNQLPSSGVQSQQLEMNSQLSSKPANSIIGQNTDSSTINSQSVQSQFGSQTFKPQGSEAFDGASLQQQRPSTNNNGNQGPQFSQTGFSQSLNRPSSGNFNNQPNPTVNPGQFGNIVSNSANKFNLPRPIPSRFGNKNEYHSSFNSNEQSQSNNAKPTSGFESNISNKGDSSFPTNTETNEQIPNFIALNEHNPGFASASASASFGQPQPSLPLNHLSEQQRSQFSSQTSAQFIPNSQSTGPFSSQTPTKPTSIPDIELTTPLEPNERQVFSQTPQISSQNKPSSFGSSPVINNQAQIQFGFEGNAAMGIQSASQTRFPGSNPQKTDLQFNAAPTQLPISSEGKPEKFKPQFTQNSFGLNRPAFNQGADNSYYYNQPPKPFNSPAVRPQPSRFPSSPSYHSNGVASHQHLQLNNQQNIQESIKLPGSPLGSPALTPAPQFSQSQGTTSNYFNGITQANISPFPSVSPAPANEFDMSQSGNFGSNQQPTLNNQGHLFGSQFKEQFSHATGQHSFPSRPVSQFSQNSIQSQFSQNPIQPQFSQNPIPSKFSQNPIPSQFVQNPIQSQTQAQFGQNEKAPAVFDGLTQQQTQQYEGTIYEYNKPMETLNIPQSDSSSSQTIQSGIFSESQPQGNKIPTPQNENSQFGSQGQVFGQNSFLFQSQQSGLVLDSMFDSLTNKPFGTASSASQFGQQSQSNQVPKDSKPQKATGSQFSAQSAKPFDSTSQTGQVNPISGSLTSSQQINQKPQTSTLHDTETPESLKPQLGSLTQFQIAQQSFGSSQNSQTVRGPQAQDSQITPVDNTVSSQDSGYFYPKNPKPQFSEQNNQNQFVQGSNAGSNEFNHNSQSESSQTAAPFDQQSQFSSALKPQFASQSQTQFNQNTQLQTSQQTVTPQAFGRPNQGQSFSSSQALALGQATASAHASSLPQQQFKPLSQNKPLSNFDQNQPNIQGQNVQGIIKDQDFATGSVEESAKPFAGQPKPVDRPFGGNTQVPQKPLFSKPCCQGSKSSAQNTDKGSQGFSSFQGSQSFTAQDFAEKGEQFNGPQQAPHFDDQTGYHY